MHVYAYTCTKFMHACMYSEACTCMYDSVEHVCVCVYTYTHTHMCLRLSAQCVSIHIFICICLVSSEYLSGHTLCIHDCMNACTGMCMCFKAPTIFVYVAMALIKGPGTLRSLLVAVDLVCLK